jgi:cytosol alanyl aminopeptidase
MRKAFLCAVLAATVACASVANSTAPQPSAPTAPKLRLPATARPLRYEVDLTVAPAKDTFSGTIDIDLELSEPTSLLWLNATELTVSDASLTAGNRRQAARIVPGGEDFVGFAFRRAAAKGRARLHAAFSGKVSNTSTTGIFHQKAGEDWYAFTQFESIDARRAFPCFDEPSFKVPWMLTLRVPKNDLAVSNTPVASEEPLAGELKAVHFTETSPLPSYLVAFGVGPFDVVDAGRAGKNSTPIRMIVPRGRGSEARYAAQTIGPLLEVLEDYFGIPYPYAKLDNVVIPQTVRFGAMENAGLVTYNETIELAKPEEETPYFRLRWAAICAHETAHQWFGDLVTLAWWNDTWLNESFATWMGGKTLERWKPEWEIPVRRVVSRSETMEGDTLVSARKIRQPIESKGDIDNAFDDISYGKGSAVLAMFEAWVGAEKFQKGVRRYLTAHANGNATAEDFLSALDAEAGPGVGKAFSTFLDQAGVPLVDVRLVCTGEETPSLVVSQRRLLPKGSPPAAPSLWSVPVCVRYGAGSSSERSCSLLTTEQARWPLSSAQGCPAWVLGNAGELGYYAAAYDGDLLEKLLASGGPQLTLPERVGVLRDLATLAHAGQVSWAKALAFVPEFAGDGNPHIVSAAVRIASGVQDHLVPDDRRINYERFIRRFFGPRARQLGWNPKPGEDEETELLRPILLRFVARAGKDPELLSEARRLALAWLDDPKAIAPDSRGSVLALAAEEGGDRALFDRFRAKARSLSDRQDRNRLLWALGRFHDPALEKEALQILLTDEFDIRESLAILWAALGHPRTRDGAWQFFKANFDALVSRMPEEMRTTLPTVGRDFCDAAHRADVETFFQERIRKLEGAQRPLAETLEAIDQCTALKADQQGVVSEFLSKY